MKKTIIISMLLVIGMMLNINLASAQSVNPNDFVELKVTKHNKTNGVQYYKIIVKNSYKKMFTVTISTNDGEDERCCIKPPAKGEVDLRMSSKTGKFDYEVDKIHLK